MASPKDPVRGYEYQPFDLQGPGLARLGHICKIIDRAPESEASDGELLELGPAFLIEWGDGEQAVVYASELRPWYPT